ncbi:YihY/virulence factor BrkB family protein [Aeromicrobium duanguangcaii]|uniref:YihY/virulence factor BrkB family protein n=1 Tax=Aeromicrobium duanguangcaii TaxID=2968086 RepID=A0ABY5KGT6_9ACTN|nr:YihY/virulence factor BrkB family protein [Aeromicrobium duanguangcaii]MCD9153206.1 YihY/virulence factor BrkB family protein [Aeromicrobium duanguangcaii]UUI69694.1 YihY/virulence factor BrkB family protein [Aeromicrobium duanguangcaii]
MPLLQTLVTAWRQASARQASLLAAGVAFFLFTSLVPALIATASIYGLVADPGSVADQTRWLTAVLPAEAASLVTNQMRQITTASTGSLGASAAAAVVAALYSASSGVFHLVAAVNQLYGLPRRRRYVVRRLVGVALTAGAIAFGLLAIAVVAVVPVVLDVLGAGTVTRLVAHLVRWLALAGAVLVAIGVLYRHAPQRPATGPLITRGVLLAGAIWLLSSAGFSIYVETVGTYARTYGALAGVIVLLLWLWIGMWAILFGACVEATREGIVSEETITREALLAQERATLGAPAEPLSRARDPRGRRSRRRRPPGR